LKETGQ
jgi:hypothetical protein